MKNWSNVVKQLEEVLDETYKPMQVGEIKIYPAKALRKCDPTAFKLAVLDYAYSEGIDTTGFKDTIDDYL